MKTRVAHPFLRSLRKGEVRQSQCSPAPPPQFSRWDDSSQSTIDLQTSLWLEFEDYPGISPRANCSAVKRPVLAEQQTGGGELVVAVPEAQKHLLGPATVALFELENRATVRRKAAVLCSAIKCARLVHSQACPGIASVAPGAGEGIKNSLRPGASVTGRRRQFEDCPNTGRAPEYRRAVQIALEQY